MKEQKEKSNENNGLIKTRKEILFLYEVIDCNPNGDPLEGNKVRIDTETQQAIVTDVRLKRTIRDYLITKGKNVFVRAVFNDKGTLLTKKEVLKEDLKGDINKERVLEHYLDLRLFGATIAEREARITCTGPVQFRFGRTLHPVEQMFYKGTTVFPSEENKGQGTFTEIHKIPYGLIAFYGVVNENAAKEIKLSEGDVNLLYEGIWEGTKSLITRSKFSHAPKLLLIIDYKEPNFFIGDLDKLVDLEKNEKPPRAFKELKLKFASLLQQIDKVSKKINKVTIWTNENKQEIEKDFKKEIEKHLTI